MRNELGRNEIPKTDGNGLTIVIQNLKKI